MLGRSGADGWLLLCWSCFVLDEGTHDSVFWGSHYFIDIFDT